MPFIRNLWVARSATPGDSGTGAETVFIVNEAGLDVVHRDMGLFREVAEGGGSFTIIDVSKSQIVPEDYYLRVGIRGDDSWQPVVIAAWCQRFTSGTSSLLDIPKRSPRCSAPTPRKGASRCPYLAWFPAASGARSIGSC